MSKCKYHPDKRSTASCPQCREPICDRCRINGTSQRCMTCQSAFSKGGAEGEREKRTRCTNHNEIPTDIRCVGCKKPHCAACLNGQQRCFKCALAGPAPSPGGARPRSKTTPLKGGAKTGKLKAPPPKRGLPGWLVPAAVGGVLVAGGLAAFLVLKPGAAPEVETYKGPVGVAIVSPVAARPLAGAQVIKLKVTGQKGLEHVEITVNGKYWDELKQPPFQSDWQTALLKNGSHTIEARAVYKGGRTAKSKLVVRTQNKRY